MSTQYVQQTPITPLVGKETTNLSSKGRLPKDANRIIFVRGLPFKITGDELYEMFAKYGSIRQIRK